MKLLVNVLAVCSAQVATSEVRGSVGVFNGGHNGGSPGGGGGSGNGGNGGNGGCIGDGCPGSGGGSGGCIGSGCTTAPPPTTTKTTTTMKPSDDPIERFMANELAWCGYLSLRNVG